MSNQPTAAETEIRALISVCGNAYHEAQQRGDRQAVARICQQSNALVWQLTEVLAAGGHQGALSVEAWQERAVGG